MRIQSSATRWQISDYEEQWLRDLIRGAYALDRGRTLKNTVELFDDFDRSLTYDGLALVREGATFRLVSASDLKSDIAICDEQKRAKAVSWQSFKVGAFQETLKKQLGLRAATCLCEVDWTTDELQVRNDDGKMVARIWKEDVSVQGGDALGFLSVSPLLGYEEEATKLARILGSSPELVPVAESLALLILKAANKAERPLSSKSGVLLEPDQRAADAVGGIASLMVQVARQNEQGILEDIDTEFLHEYRVSIRKLRSVLALVKGVYEKSETKRLKTVFGDFAKRTNRLRDLDVYLLDQEKYRERLSPWLRPGLDRMFMDFRSERKTQLAKLRRHLRSQSYESEISKESEAFAEGTLPSGPRATLPIYELVSAEIKRHYKLVRKLGKRIGDRTPDEEVHELRIECKKLRYLLELFGGLYPAKPMAKVGKALKRLQTVLGRFNDFSVQQESLQAYLEGNPKLDNLTAAAVGALIESLHIDQRAARAEVVGRFNEFEEGKIPTLFSAMLVRESEVSE